MKIEKFIKNDELVIRAEFTKNEFVNVFGCLKFLKKQNLGGREVAEIAESMETEVFGKEVV